MRFMDLLAKRYASPFILLENMVRQQRLFEFVVEVNSIVEEETYESQMWDIWLHKIFDKGYDEWKKQVSTKVKVIDKAELEATVKNSMELLNAFNPD